MASQWIFRRVGYMYGGNGGKNVRELINPWEFKQLRPKEEIFEFDEFGTVLVYSYKHSILRTVKIALSRILPTITISLEPLSLPVFMALGLFGCWKTFTCLADNALSLSEVRLKKDGLHVEIALLDWLGRATEHKKFTMEIKDLAPPNVYSDSVPLKGDLFPHLQEVFEIQSEEPSKPWIKYYDGTRKKFLIHKDYIYMDQEIMCAIMNGFYISTIKD